jgi:dTDP-4-amino-4,6-dideoxygalactose transaminase
MRVYRIPFNKPTLTGRELEYIRRAIDVGQISGDGEFSRRCCALMEKRFSADTVLLTTSCTDALEIAAVLLDIAPGDEVILPSYAFVTTANAFVLRGARPVFVDIRSDTLNLDEKLVEERITGRTRAIVALHYAGVGCEMDGILATAARHGISVVEDAAQGVNALYRGRYLGTIGRLGAYSFHETKNYICGEGGAVLINDHVLVERAEIVRQKGTDRSRFLRGRTDKYTWCDIGSSHVLSDLLAAFLYAQLEQMDRIQAVRKRIFDAYRERLQPLQDAGKLRLPVIPEHCDTNYHMFYVLLPDERTRNKVIDGLRERGILAVFHYVPLHTSPMGKRYGCQEGDLPVTEDVSARLLRLPFYNSLSESDIELVTGGIRAIL